LPNSFQLIRKKWDEKDGLLIMYLIIFLFTSFSRLGQHAFSYLLPGSLQVICSDRDKQEEKKGGFLGLLTSHAVTSVSCFFVLY